MSKRHLTLQIALLYSAIAVVMTWPLVLHLSTSLASDVGDPAFNCWVMMWTAGQVLALFRGDFHALHDYWNGNIYYPSRLTIAYSEHLSPQMAQILPLYAATGNIVLCYNLLFLSTFALSGLGMYLLVRELTGNKLAAFFAGLAFAYAPYRIAQFTHLQVLSVQWMPLALYGFRRYFVTGRRRPLVGGSIALWLQNLSCGYFLLFFSPFAAAYCLYEMARRRLFTSWRTCVTLLVAAVAVACLTWPFVAPYLQVRRAGEVGVRTYGEAVRFSADTHGLFTPPAASRLWGGLDAQYGRRTEGEGMPGVTIGAFAILGAIWGMTRWIRRRSLGDAAPWRLTLLGFVVVAWVLNAVLLAKLLFHGNFGIAVGSDWIVIRGVEFWTGLFAALVGAAVILIHTAPRRQATQGDTIGFFAISAIAAELLARGPQIFVRGHPIGLGPYHLLYRYVPGFDGLRVPARYLMIAALFLAGLAGMGAAMLLRRYRTAGTMVVAVGCLGILAESWVAPMRLNGQLRVAENLNPTPATVTTGSHVSPLYQLVRSAPPDTVLIEFPFGAPPYEILADFYAGYHRKPIVNGYSGFFPPSYGNLGKFLRGIPTDWDAATSALRSSFATMALVHQDAYVNGRSREIVRWLEGMGATLMASDGGDRLYALPPTREAQVESARRLMFHPGTER